MMHGHEKSDSAIVAVKPMNKAERSAAESVERRAETKGNVDQQHTRRARSKQDLGAPHRKSKRTRCRASQKSASSKVVHRCPPRCRCEHTIVLTRWGCAWGKSRRSP